MRTTDFCFPLPDYEYPCFVSYRHLFEAYASPLADGLAPMSCFRNRPTRPVDLAFHDAESASAGFFRVGARYIPPALPLEPYLWHPCRFRFSGSALSRGAFVLVAEAASFASP
jgi:hypothetical protein